MLSADLSTASCSSIFQSSTGVDVKCTRRRPILKVASFPPGLVVGFGGVVKLNQGVNTGKADWSLRLVRPIKSSCGVSATLQPALREPPRIRTLETTPLLRREKREAQPMPPWERRRRDPPTFSVFSVLFDGLPISRFFALPQWGMLSFSSKRPLGGLVS